MNFSGFDFGKVIENQLSAMENSHRIPHAVIITGGNEINRKELCEFLSMWAVCTSEDKPCTCCSQCCKVKEHNHSDVYHAKGTGKTNGILVDEIRSINADSIIIPNEAPVKVYILENVDKRMNQESLNAFLKTLEEPVQDTLFLLTAENLKAVPVTILSRCTTLTLQNTIEIKESVLENSKNIVLGIVDKTEMPLLKATSVLLSRAAALEVLPVVRLILSDALALSVGAEPVFEKETATTISGRLTKTKIIMLIDTTTEAINKINRNVGLGLLSTWLCSEYRRIICVM